MPAFSPGTAAATESGFARALAALEAELSVVFVARERVEAACAALREGLLDVHAPGHGERVRRVAALLHSRTAPFMAPIAELLRDTARANPSPWPVLESLLASRDAAICALALGEACDLARRGALPVDVDLAARLAALVDRDASPLAGATCLPQVAGLLSHLPRRPGADVDPTVELFAAATSPSLRRLAARLLDAAGERPTRELVTRLVGEADAPVLAPLLAYTRASHLDLADLVPEPGGPSPVAESVRAGEAILGRAAMADVIAELGWPSVTLGFAVRQVVGVTVDDSLPLLVTPAEASLLSGCPGARRVLEQAVVVGHGGRSDAAGAGGSGQEAVARFRAYNLVHAEVLGEILDVGPLTPEKVRRLLERMDGITGEFSAIFASRSDECTALPRLYADLKARILAELATATAGRPLSVELTRLVQMFEDPSSLAEVRTLHGLKRYLHQRGLALGFGLLEASHGTNRTVDFAVVASGRVLGVVRQIEYVDFDPGEAPGGQAVLPYPVTLVVDAFVRQWLQGQTSLPRVRVFCYGNEVHYFVSFRNHPVFVRIDFSPPLGGGMIDLAYYGVSKYELDAHPAIGLEAIQACFRRLDFFVEVDNTRIHARFDKERALDLADVCEKAEALFRLVPYLMDLDWTVGSLALSDAARRQVGLAWADLFARWGSLPATRLLTEDRIGILVGREARPEGACEVRWNGEGTYRDAVSERPGAELPAFLHAELARRGLDVPLVEREREVGQVSLDRHLLRPLRAAVARGELVEADGGLRPAPPDRYRRQHEADRFALLLASGEATLARAAHMARLATALERSLRFETTGSVNGYEVQRAALVLRDSRGALYALRDSAGIFRLAMYSPDDVICRRKSSASQPWLDNVSFDVGALAALLRRNNFLPSWIDAPAGGEGPEVAHLRAVLGAPNPVERARPLPGEHAVACMKASPGRAVGLARLGTRGRRPDDLGGGVLFAATLGPDDQAFLLHAAAVVGTGGGILSHAGLMAVQCGRPAVIMTGTWRDAADGTPSLVYLRTEFDERERTVEGHRVVERCGLREYEERVREGDVVVVDADEGVVRVLGQGPVALALHDALEHLERTARRLAAAISPEDVLAHRGRRLRAVHQLEKLVARIDEPALVQHAVRELLAGSAAGTAEGSLRDTVHLLRLFCGHPATGTLAAGCVGRIAREVAARHASAHDLAVRRIPTARSPDEVLVLRRSALQLCDTVEQVRNVLAAAGAEAPPSPRGGVERIDALARHRLEAMRDTAVTELRSASQRDPQPPSLRHVLRLAQRLVEVVGAPLEVTRTLDAVRDSLVRRDEAAVRRLESRWVLWPDDGGLELEPLAGSKAANLAELGRVGAAALVPSWFVVTDRAFRAALGCLAPARPGTPWQAGGTGLTLGDAIEAVVSRTDADPEQKSSLVGQLWADVRLPPALLAEVTAAYRRLADDGDPYVAIRSSAREEDTETAARAGEFDTFLFVKGAESVVQHLRRAWSGLWTARAIHDRAIYGRGGRGEGGGILVQRIAWSRVAGVLQTTNVAEGRSREMVVNAGLGLGEGVVSGLVAADHVVVSRDEDPETEPLRFHYVTADKRERVIFDERAGHGTVRTDVLAHQRLRAALEYVELVELVRVATRLEAVYGYPLDIEFGLEHAALRILQVRPVPGALAAWRDASETHPLDATRSSLPTARSADATADEPAREQRGPR